MSKVIEGLRYSEDHEWVKVEGNIAIIGITDYAQKELGDITYADLPEVDDEVEAGDEFGALESVKASSELLCPVSGKVVEVNPELRGRSREDQRGRLRGLDHQGRDERPCTG